MKETKRRANFVFLNALLTGFFGGGLLASSYLLFYYFNVSNINHKYILAFFRINGSWLHKWYGYLFFIMFISLLSVVLAIIYYLLFRKIKGWILGAVFGISLWVIFGLLIPLFVYDMTFTSFYKSYTNVLSFCALLLYGIFIGYSISYDEEMSKFDKYHE